MKKILMLLVVLPIACSAMAQEKFPFIAKTSDEFTNPVMDPTIKNVHVNNSDYIMVKRDRGGEEYSMDDIWGYRDKHGKEYRVYNGDSYQLLEAGRLCIYTRVADVTDVDAGGTPSTEVYPTAQVKYYFSRRIGGDIYELNEKNLAAVFAPTNEKFVELVQSCKDDDKLAQYNKKVHEYKVEELYKESKIASN